MIKQIEESPLMRTRFVHRMNRGVIVTRLGTSYPLRKISLYDFKIVYRHNTLFYKLQVFVRIVRNYRPITQRHDEESWFVVVFQKFFFVFSKSKIINHDSFFSTLGVKNFKINYLIKTTIQFIFIHYLVFLYFFFLWLLPLNKSFCGHRNFPSLLPQSRHIFLQSFTPSVSKSFSTISNPDRSQGASSSLSVARSLPFRLYSSLSIMNPCRSII